MHQLEESIVPGAQCIPYQKTLDLVRELSEHKRTKDPHRRFKISKLLPKVTERMARRFIQNDGNGIKSMHGKILICFISGLKATCFKTKTEGRYLLEWESGRSSFASDKELLTEFSEAQF